MAALTGSGESNVNWAPAFGWRIARESKGEERKEEERDALTKKVKDGVFEF